MQRLFLVIASHLNKSIFDVSEPFHPLKSNQNDISFKILHNMSGMQVPEEKTTLMHELNTSEKVFENLFRRKGYLCKGMFVHFKGHNVVSHRLVDIVYLIDADLFGLDDIFPQSFVECYLTFH